MARRFAPGVQGLLQGLMWVQAEAATGSLRTAGAVDGPGLVFKDGILAGLSGEDQASADALGDRARAVLEDWVFSNASFVFTEGDAAGALPAGDTGGLNAGDLILETVRQDADPRWVSRQLSTVRGKVSAAPAQPKVQPQAAMTPTEAFLLSRADGSMSLEEIVKVSPMEAREVTLSLYGLVLAGLLSAPGARPPEDPREAAPGQEAPPSPVPEGPAEKVPPAASPAGGPGTVPEKTAPGAGPAPPAAKVSALDDFLARTSQPAGEEKEATAPEAARAPAASSGKGPGGDGDAAVRRPEIEKFREEVLEWISQRAGSDHFGVLGIDRTAGEPEIRRAYYSLAKKFHPDKFRRPGFEGLLKDVEKMFAATTAAYNTLTDDRTRAEYEAESAVKGRRSPESDLAAQARESFLRARKHIEAEEFFDAASLLETACRLDAGKPEYWLALGSVQERNPKWRRKAEESYQQVLAIDPTSADAYLHLARLYKAGGLNKRSMEMFKKVLEWDPDNEEAQAGAAGKEASEGAGVKGRIRSIFKGSRS